MRYTLSKMSILGIVIFVFSLLFTIRGITIRYQLINVNESYDRIELKNGRYIECDIAKEQLIGTYYTDKSGIIKYNPYCNENALSSEQTYIVAINKSLDYYVPLVIPREYQKDFRQIINSDKTYHLFGKFEKFNNILYYDTISQCTGIDSTSKINQMISAKHQIKAVEPKNERRVLYQGFSLLASGLLILFVTIIRKRLDNIGNPAF